MKYEFILFDADDTLFDFQQSAMQSLLAASRKFNIPDSLFNYELYHSINQKYWDLYSLGKVSKSDLLYFRFSDYLKQIGVEVNIDKMSRAYEETLSKTCILFPETTDLLCSLKQRGLRLFLITNGTASVQRGRLAISGIEKYFEEIFISDELGVAKPDKRFVDAIYCKVLDFDKSKALIVGDSPLTDISLGINCNIDTCFYNPKKAKTDLPVSYEIRNFNELLSIVK